MKSILIIGPGSVNGLGMEIAKIFGRQGYKILTISRNNEKLFKFKRKLSEKNILNEYWVANSKDKQVVSQSLLEMISLHEIELVIFNLSLRRDDDIIKLEPEEVLSSIENNSTSLLNFVHPILPHLKKNSGAIITTGGGLGIHPDYHKSRVSIDKSVLRVLTFLLHDKLKTSGIFVGTITIAASIKEHSSSAPKNIAPLYWNMFVTRKTKEILFSD